MTGQDTELPFEIRLASLADVPALEQLIAASARALSRADYTDAQIEGALGSAFGVDTTLIQDGTYFVVEVAGILAGCGGWSRRATLFGSDAQPGRQSATLDPATDAARIRAFFIHPDWARRGLGRALLRHCEAAARASGFREATLMATLPGVRLYQSCGYLGTERAEHLLPNGERIPFLPMWKNLIGTP